MALIEAASVGVDIFPDMGGFRELLRTRLVAAERGSSITVPIDVDDRRMMRALTRIQTAAANITRGLRNIGGRGLEVLTGRAATLAATLLTVAPAAQTGTMAIVAGAGAASAAIGTAAIALGAFAAAAIPQLNAVGEAADLYAKAQEAAALGGEQAAAAQAEYNRALAAMPPHTRVLTQEFIKLKEEFSDWSDSLAPKTMPVFAKGIQILRRAIPALTPLVETAADALWDFLVPIEQGVKGGAFSDFMDEVNEAAKDVLPDLLDSARNVGVGIAGIFEAFLPHAPAMSSGIEDLTAKFARWGQSLESSDSFREFMDHVRAHLPALTGIFSNLVAIVGNLAPALLPLSGISLQIVEGFTGILAALPPDVLTALAGGFVAVTAAVRILTPVVRVLNFVMRMNPIGLVVTALALLVAGLVLAYRRSETFRNIVDGAWAAVQKAVSVAWRDWIKPALEGIADLFRDAYNTWQEIWPGMEELLGQVSAFFSDVLKGAIDDVSGAFGGLGDNAVEATDKVSGIGQGFKDTEEDGNGFLGWSTIFGAGIGQIFGGFTGIALGAVTGYFWPQTKEAFSGGFTNLREQAGKFADWLPGALRRGLTSAGGAISSGMRTLHRRLFDGLPPLRMSWSSFWNWTRAFAGNAFDLVGDLARRGLNAIERAFDRGVSAIRAVWRRLPGAVKSPINWVINTGYNDGIRRLWNTVMGWLKLPGGLQLGRVPALERGGTLANPAKAQPMMTRGPMAIVGEGRPQWPEFVIPTDPKYRGRAQALWTSAGGHLQMLARGGVLGDVLGGIKRLAGKVFNVGRQGLDLLDNPSGIWDRLARQIIPGSGHLGVDKFGKGMARVIPTMAGRTRDAALDVIKAFADGYGGDARGVVKAAERYLGVGDRGRDNDNIFNDMWGWPTGTPWCANFVSTAIRDAKAGDKYAGYPTASVAVFNSRMRHVPTSQGRPGDLATYRGNGHVNIITGKAGSAYRTIGGNEGPVVRRGVRGGQTAVLRPMARGGILGQVFGRELPYAADPADRRDPLAQLYRRALGYDNGGYMPPGLGVYDNRTGRPEPVLNPRQWDIAERALAEGAAGGGDTYNIYARTADFTVRDLELLQRRKEARDRVGRPR